MGFCGSCLRLTFVLLSLVAAALLFHNNRFGGRIRMFYPLNQWSTKDLPDLSGKVMLITGANVGLGKETAIQLAKKGAKVVLACRETKCAPVAKEINDKFGAGKAISMSLDLSDSKSIYAFAQEYKKTKLPIHSLVLNAGVLIPEWRATADGLEQQVGINFIGHFYLQHLLQDVVEASAPSRIVILSSGSHEEVTVTSVLDTPDLGLLNTKANREAFSPTEIYGVSKIANIYHAKELDARMKKAGKKVTVVAVHPGMAITEIVRHIPDWCNKLFGEQLGKYALKVIETLFSILYMSVEHGALSQIYAAGGVGVENISGSYIVPTAVVSPGSDLARSSVFQTHVWNVAEKIIADWPK